MWEIKLNSKELKALNHLINEKVAELQRLNALEIALRIGGSSSYFQDLITFSTFLRERVNLASPWRKEHIVEIKEKELQWAINFARDKMGQLIRARANYYGQMTIDEFEKLIKKLEQRKGAKIVL